MTGYVYIIEGAGLHKIGATKSPVERRLAALKIGSPVPLRLVLKLRVRDCYNFEAALHRRFCEQRQHGEWFHLTPADIATIKESRAVRTATTVTIPVAAAMVNVTLAALYTAIRKNRLMGAQRHGRLTVKVDELKRYRRETKIGRPKNGKAKK